MKKLALLALCGLVFLAACGQRTPEYAGLTRTAPWWHAYTTTTTAAPSGSLACEGASAATALSHSITLSRRVGELSRSDASSSRSIKTLR